jgi:hypothetical protein
VRETATPDHVTRRRMTRCHLTLSALRDASSWAIRLALVSSTQRGLRRVMTPASARTRWIRLTGVCCTAPLLSQYGEALWHSGGSAGLSPNFGTGKKPCMWPIPRFEDSSDLPSWNGGQSKPGLPRSCRESFEAVPDREALSEPCESKKPPGGRLLYQQIAGVIRREGRSRVGEKPEDPLR